MHPVRRMAVAVIAALAAAVLLSNVTYAQNPACKSLAEKRDKTRAALDKILAEKLPEEQIDDLTNTIDQILEVLQSNIGDQKEVEKKIGELQKNLPKSDSNLVKQTTDALKQITGGVAKSREFQETAKKALTELKNALTPIAAAYGAGDESTMKGQIQKFGDFVDGLSKVPGVEKVPGLGELFKAYTESINLIAKDAGRIDDVMARNRKIYRDAGFTDDLYFRQKTRRDIRSDTINRLSDELVRIEEQLAAGGCTEPDETKPRNVDADICTDRCRSLRDAWMSAQQDAAPGPKAAQREMNKAKEDLTDAKAKVAEAEEKLAAIQKEAQRKGVEPSTFPSWQSWQEAKKNRQAEAASRETRFNDRASEAGKLQEKQQKADVAKQAYYQCVKCCWDDARTANSQVKVPEDVVAWEKDNPDGSCGIDPCLVGTWECTTFKEANQFVTGGGTGFRVSFKKDGTETVDYSNMKPVESGPRDKTIYSGRADAKISTKDGVAKIESMVSADVVATLDSGVKNFSWPKLKTLGPGGLGSPTGMSYTCTGDTLEYQTTPAGNASAKTSCTVTMTRVKGGQ